MSVHYDGDALDKIYWQLFRLLIYVSKLCCIEQLLNDTPFEGFASFPPQNISGHCFAFLAFQYNYRKNPKISDTQNICCNHPKSWTRWHFLTVMHPKDAAGIANSVDPDQTALGAVWSGSALFAQTCLTENLGTLRYRVFLCFFLTFVKENKTL